MPAYKINCICKDYGNVAKLIGNDVVNVTGAVMLKYDFAIRTRDGQRLESLVIGGIAQQDAERKLNQMYRYCEILRCESKESGIRQSDSTSVEDILSLISK